MKLHVTAQAKMVAMPLRRKSEEKTPPSLKELKAIMDLLEAISAEADLALQDAEAETAQDEGNSDDEDISLQDAEGEAEYARDKYEKARDAYEDALEARRKSRKKKVGVLQEAQSRKTGGQSFST